MTILFYKSSDDPKKVNKTLTLVGSADGVPVSNTDDTISLLSPGFILQYSSTLTTATHIYVAAMGNRYYFVGDIQLLTGGKMYIPCSEDYLYTWKTGIKASKGTVVRAENPKSKQISDSKFPLIAQMETESTLFPAADCPFTASSGINYVLTVVGGGE